MKIVTRVNPRKAWIMYQDVCLESAHDELADVLTDISTPSDRHFKTSEIVSVVKSVISWMTAANTNHNASNHMS